MLFLLWYKITSVLCVTLLKATHYEYKQADLIINIYPVFVQSEMDPSI